MYPSLAPGADVARCAEVTRSAGIHSVTAVVDQFHVIDESDESNNDRTEDLEWQEEHQVPPEPA